MLPIFLPLCEGNMMIYVLPEAGLAGIIMIKCEACCHITAAKGQQLYHVELPRESLCFIIEQDTLSAA